MVTNSRVLSPDEKRRMIKTTDGRFRSTNTSIMKYINTFGGTFNGPLNTGEDSKYETLKKLHSKRIMDHEDRFVHNYELTSLDNRQPSAPILRQSNAFDYRDKMETIKFTRSLSRSSKDKQTNKFVPKLSVRVNEGRSG